MQIVTCIECLFQGGCQGRKDLFGPFDRPVGQGGAGEGHAKAFFRDSGDTIQRETVDKFARTDPSQNAR